MPLDSLGLSPPIHIISCATWDLVPCLNNEKSLIRCKKYLDVGIFENLTYVVEIKINDILS